MLRLGSTDRCDDLELRTSSRVDMPGGADWDRGLFFVGYCRIQLLWYTFVADKAGGEKKEAPGAPCYMVFIH